MKEKTKAKTKYYVKYTLRNAKKVVRKTRENNLSLINDVNAYLNENKISEVFVSSDELARINIFGKSNGEIDKLEFKSTFNEIKDSINLVFDKREKINIKKYDFYGINNEIKVFNFGERKLAYISYTPKNKFSVDLKQLKIMILSSLKIGASFVICFINNESDNDSWNNFRYINKTLGSVGVNYLVYSNGNNEVSIHDIKFYRTDKLCYITESVGALVHENLGSMIHVEVNLSNISELREYYVGYKFNDGKLMLLDEKENKKEVTYFNTLYNNLKIKNRVYTLKEILSKIDLEVPKEYEYLASTGINKVCGRTTEVSGNDIFVLIEPFNDKNDKYVASTKEKIESAKKALSMGAVFIISYTKLDKSIPHIVVDDARESHVKLCSYLSSLNDVITIGITGSVGKTTTKDMLDSVLSQKYNVAKSLRNANVQVKMGIHIQRIQPENEIFIQEIGGGRPGGASRHSRMINPDIALVTNIGSAHLGNYEDQHDLMINKLGVMDGFGKNGVFYLNLDDDNLKNAKIDKKYVTYSSFDKTADFYASDIDEKGTEIDFVINNNKTKEKIKAHLNVSGRHNVLNAIACFAIGKGLGLTNEQIIKGLDSFETSGIRQNLITIANQKFMLDCYNSSLDSVLASMRSFDKMKVKKGAKKIAVIGDVTGAGEETESIHHTIANSLKDYNFDKIILIGNFTKIISEDLNKYSKEHIYLPMNESKKLTDILKNELNSDDVVLLKGSSKVLLEYHLDLIYGTNLSEIRFSDTLKFVTIPVGSYKYRYYYKYSMLYKYIGRESKINIKNNLMFSKVRGVSNFCFKNNKYVKEVNFMSNHVHIGISAFENCVNLKNVNLKNVLMISECAFKNCKSLKEIKLNEGLLHISKNAFEGCVNLEKVYLPSSIKQIEEDVFKDCNNVKIECEKGSYAYKYAKESGLDIL